MSAAQRTLADARVPAETPEPLEPGDRLTGGEFLRRYHAMPNVHKAELIEGVVYMPLLVNHVRHGEPHVTLATWIGVYASKTPGVNYGDNSTVRLDGDNVPQPDLLLRLPEKAGGRSRIDSEGYLNGAPELLIEVASSSTGIDLHDKLNAYRRNGVLEYVVWRVRDQAVDWFVLEDGQYVPLAPDPADGLLKSRVFPGLWLDAPALLVHDLPRLMQVIDRGAAIPEHAAFVARLGQ